MRRMAWRQEIRLMRLEEACEGWTEHHLTQIDAARLLGGYPRTSRRASIDEVMRLVDLVMR